MKDTSPGEISIPLPAPSTLTSIRARLGDAPSQAALGVRCSHGGRFEEAFDWLDRAAQQWPIASILYYNTVISSGTKSSRFKERAIVLLRAAANLGSWEALQVLSSLYIHGEGVPRDLDEASRLIERSVSIRRVNGA